MLGRRSGLLLALLACLAAFSASAVSASAETSTFTTFAATQTIPVPPASNFAGSGGGDGWAVALSGTSVYNVFHHYSSLKLACHLQASAESCFSPETITDGEGNGFLTGGQPGLHLDQSTGKLYVFATRASDYTAGVVCMDTTIATSNPNPFCGFTALTGIGKAIPPGGTAGISDPMLVGTHLYSFNYQNGVEQGEGQNELMCFDLSTGAACAGQPFAVSIGAGTVSATGYPAPATALIGTKLIIPIHVGSVDELACFDGSTQSSCAGAWPAATGTSYASSNGAPFPLLDGTGALTGLCIPTGTDQCFNLAGESTATPAGMPAIVGASDGWNGPAFVIGPRVYLPNGNTNTVECFDYATGAGCSNFPKSFSELGYLYTVNSDPQRPSCIWVNADNGSAQIQNFDAYTGEACGKGAIRALASQFVVPAPQCKPASFVSLQILQPARASYASGSVAFQDGDGNPIPGLAERPLDGTGTASLAGLELNTATGLPQFLITLNGTSGEVGSVEVKLTWTGDYNATCIGAKTSVVTPTAAPPAPKTSVLAFKSGSAHLASSSRACVASSSYLASVKGKNIASVTFLLNGHKLKKVSKANSHGAFTLRVGVKAGQVEHLSMHVAYVSGTSPTKATLTKRLARCAAVRHVKTPRFTG